MRGNISRRGKSSWRIKFDIGSNPASGKREIRYATVRGKRQDAERELARLIGAAHDGTFVEASKTTVTDYLHAWLDGAHGLAGKTVERYRQLAEQQVIPHLGALALQKLRPKQIADWHSVLLQRGGKDERPLSPRTVHHAHRLLHHALARAVRTEILPRNVASVVRPPKVSEPEIESLRSDQIASVLEALNGHPLQPIATLALSTGARRGELLGLAWGHIDLDNASMRIERSVEQTKTGLKFKTPKTRNSRRTVSLPPTAITALRTHRRQQLEIRMALGQGKPDADALVFGTVEGQAIPPNNLSRDWWRFIKTRRLPPVSLHGLRHSHVSALIASGIDPLTISRRIGHASPVVTLRTYAHMFQQTDTAAAEAIEAALQGGKVR